MKAVIITGALGGIGRTLCEEFTEAGYAVVATDRCDGSPRCRRFLKIDIRELCRSADARRSIRDEILDAIQDLPLHAVVNNAAVQILGATADLSVDAWQDTLETNLLAPFFLAQIFLPELTESHGSVVNIASIHAVATKPGFVAYATSKAALVGMTRAMAVDLGSNVRVNAILPAAVATPMLLEGFASAPSGLEQLGGMHPLGRIARPSEVAGIALFLVSDRASFMSGAAVQLDGGIGSRLHDPA